MRKKSDDKNPININALIRKKWEILKLISLSISTGDKKYITKPKVRWLEKKAQLNSQCANNCLKTCNNTNNANNKKLIKNNFSKHDQINILLVIYYTCKYW